jgi:hypothetical protein
MTNPPDDIPAFPFRYSQTNPNYEPREMVHPGMTLRDWFAGQALAGFCQHTIPQLPMPDADLQKLVTSCYEVGDAMLAGRENPQNKD